MAAKQFLSFSVAWHRNFYLGSQLTGLLEWRPAWEGKTPWQKFTMQLSGCSRKRMTSVYDNGFCMSPPSPPASSAMTGGPKENYLYSPSHIDFFLTFPKKRQDEDGKIPLSVLYITVHSQNTCQWTEWNSVLNRKRHQKSEAKAKTQVYQPIIKHDKKWETIHQESVLLVRTAHSNLTVFR